MESIGCDDNELMEFMAYYMYKNSSDIERLKYNVILDILNEEEVTQDEDSTPKVPEPEIPDKKSDIEELSESAYDDDFIEPATDNNKDQDLPLGSDDDPII